MRTKEPEHFFKTSSKYEKDIKINGLIWMGDYAFMSKQIQEKLEKGFHCIKVKIGSLNFKDEINLLKQIRKNFKPTELELRVDANGAYTSTNISKILSELAKLDIHSIEQPIAVNQWDEMKKLCKSSPIPIALDEELINPYTKKQKEDLLRPTKIYSKEILNIGDSLVGKMQIFDFLNNKSKIINLRKNPNCKICG